MRDKIVVTRYGEAYVAFALPVIGMPRLISDMHLLHGVLREVPELHEFLRAPEVTQAEKGAFLDKVFAETLAAETRDFVKYLIVKRRIDRLREIADYIRVVYSHGEVVDVVLKSTFPLELGLAERIKSALGLRTGKNVNLYFELDPDLLGGVQVTIGNKIIDGSVRHRLDELKKQLLKTQVV